MGKIVQVQQRLIERPFYRKAHWVSRAGLLLLLFLAGCGGGGSTAFAPQVVKTDPGNEAGNVPVNAPIRATFSYDIDPVTVNRETFIVSGVHGIVDYQDKTATFTPSPETPLEEGKKYFAVLTTGIKDLDGISLPSNFTWSFETSGLPKVERVEPKEEATDVPVQTSITALFSKSIDARTLNAQTFFMKKEGSSAAVAAAVSYDDPSRTATVDPGVSLDPSAKYTVTLTTGVADRAGKSLEASKTWSFVTASEPDRTPPKVISQAPAPNAGGISTNTSISVTFDEKVDLGSLRSYFFLEGPNGAVPTTLIYDFATSPTASLQLGSNLNFATTYRVVLQNGIKDTSENRLPSDIVWSFTTGSAPDHIAPRVKSRRPEDGAEGISVRSPVTVEFSEPMDANSVTTQNNFAVYRIQKGGRESVAGSVTIDNNLLTASFTPSARLKYDATYSVILSGQVKDLAGNLLDQTGFWMFTTTSPPGVVEQWPAPNEQNVAPGREIAARFSRPMAETTIKAESFQVVRAGPAGGGISGTIRYDAVNHVAIFTPDPPLQSGAMYQVTLSTAIEDLEQNPLESPVVWFFSMASSAPPDTTPPQVVGTDPAHGAGGVSPTDPSGSAARLQATFSEAVRADSVHPGSFVVEKIEFDSSRRGVSGTIQPHPSDSATFFFAPDVPLDRGANYEAKLTTGIIDLAGNPLPSNHVWSFTTAP